MRLMGVTVIMIMITMRMSVMVVIMCVPMMAPTRLAQKR